MRRNINLKGKSLAYALYAIGSVFALLLLLIVAGCANDKGNPSNDPFSYPPGSMEESIEPYYGQTSLKERIANSDVVIHARLSSVDGTATELKDSGQGMAALAFKFQVVEYLKGNGKSELGVISDLRGWNLFDSREAAEKDTKDWAGQRPADWWENRDALLFLVDAPNWWTGGLGASGNSNSLYFFTLSEFGEFTIESRENRVWLPAVDNAGTDSQSSSEVRFLTEVPPDMATAQRSTNSSISISEMRALVAEVDVALAQGKGVEGYKECIQEKYRVEREYASTFGSSLANPEISTAFTSDLPAGSVLHSGRVMAARPGDEKQKLWLTGKDASLFTSQVVNVANENMESIIGITTISFDNQIISNRPIPKGMYKFYDHIQLDEWIPCNFYPNKQTSEWTITVTAPAGTLHEAFFDPVAIGSGFGADATNGVLKPASLMPPGSATTIDSIAWQDGQVKMSLTPHTTLADKHIDFLALDASIALRLDFDDAVVVSDGSAQSLVWGVCKQPWQAGDLLMLRISESDGDVAGATSDTECLLSISTPTATPVPTTTPSQ